VHAVRKTALLGHPWGWQARPSVRLVAGTTCDSWACGRARGGAHVQLPVIALACRQGRAQSCQPESHVLSPGEQAAAAWPPASLRCRMRGVVMGRKALWVVDTGSRAGCSRRGSCPSAAAG